VDRGDVHLTAIDLPVPGGVTLKARDKYLILLQSPSGMDSGATNIACAIASTDRRGASPARAFEVSLGIGDGFRHETIADCRWVYTILRALLHHSTRQFRLSEERMDEISVGVFVGLQLTM
jgi:hypothetical protein